MDLIFFPFERVIEINVFILENEPGMKGAADINKLQGALGRIDESGQQIVKSETKLVLRTHKRTFEKLADM